MNIYHTHHIIPKHMGGTDDPSNLVQLTVKEHAAAHKKLYEEHGNWQDYLAWKALAGQVKADVASYIAWRIGSYKGTKHLKGKTYEEAYGPEGAEIRRQQIIDSNKRRKGIKLNTPKFNSNIIRVSCMGCKKETTTQGLGHHKKRCF